MLGAGIMRAQLTFTGLAIAALLVATGGSPTASASADTTGPTIVMQPWGHFVVGAPVTCSGSCTFDQSQSQVFDTQAVIKWSGSDPSGVCDYQVWNDSGRDVPLFMADVGKATSYTLRTGDIDGGNGGYDYLSIEIRAMDCAGNWTHSGSNCPNCGPGDGWPFPITERALNLPDNWNAAQSFDDNGATYSNPAGTWTHSTGAVFMGGSDIHAVKAGASMAYTYNGATFALVGELGPGRGSAKVYQDGILKATVNENAAINTPPTIVWANWFPVAGLHTIKIVLVGTAGHPRFDVDGFFVGPTY